MSDRRIALYARVSTEQQAPDHTIASLVAALHERIAADEQSLAPEDAYVDVCFLMTRRLAHAAA